MSLGGLSAKLGGMMSKVKEVPGVVNKGFSSMALGASKFQSAHPFLTGMAHGAVGGFIGSGGDIGGAVLGAGLGGFGNRRGWSEYNPKSTSAFGKARNKFTGKLGGYISKSSPELASAFGPQKMKDRTYTSRQSGASITESEKMVGHARNVGGKRLAAQSIGRTMSFGAGIGGGLAWGLGKSLAKETYNNIGGTFGSQIQHSYGNAFSGMGNGTITGY